jgi:glycosyltransferase involved in cell wall biosynthesis
MPDDILLILIAPNVSEQMGGEAIKALQIFQELTKLHPNTVQITHGRNRAEIARLGLKNVEFIDDTRFALLVYRSVIFSPTMDTLFSTQAVRLAEKIARDRGFKRAVIHQTEPNSPVLPRALSSQHVNVFGPINGNIYYPPIFRHRETRWVRLRRVLHMPLQRLNRLRPGGIKRADQILVAGGERSNVSLRVAGCPPAVLRESLDCGIPDRLLDRPRITQTGANLRFIHFGRLVFHKGTVLIIESLAKTRLPICLDIVGRGPELEQCRETARRLGLEDRVRFLDWYTAQEDLFDSFSQYRGVVLPSIEDANGIVIQEAMALGLPPICLDWGGPSLLIEHGRSGYLVAPTSIDHITSGLAECMDQLAEDGALAESMSTAARATAQGWRWSVVAAEWLAGLPTARRSTA